MPLICLCFSKAVTFLLEFSCGLFLQAVFDFCYLPYSLPIRFEDGLPADLENSDGLEYPAEPGNPNSLKYPTEPGNPNSLEYPAELGNPGCLESPGSRESPASLENPRSLKNP